MLVKSVRLRGHQVRFLAMLRIVAILIFVGWLPAFGQKHGGAEPPTKTTVCELIKNPKQWNQKLVQVTGFASHGFEDSVFSDPECDSRLGLWMEFGGRRATGTMSTVSTNVRDRSQPAVVEGIDIPLVEDEMFRRFDRALHRSSHGSVFVRATVIARYFKGTSDITDPVKRALAGGYGHLGCCALFMIQQVLDVQEQSQVPDLDWNRGTEYPKADCWQWIGNELKQPAMIAAQRRAEHGEEEYAFTDPQRVAMSALPLFSSKPKVQNIRLQTIKESSFRKVYKATEKGRKTKYLIVVSKPAWLSFYAKDKQRIAWVVVDGDQIDCKWNGAIEGE